MKINNARLVLAAALSLAAMTSAQAEGLSFNIGAVSLYKYHGIDQDSRSTKAFRPAIQGGVDYDFGNGLYVGNWNSTGKFGNANLEMDFYGGIKGPLADGVSYDIGFTSYIYPNSGGGWNGNELFGGLTFGIFSVKYSRGVSGSIDKYSRVDLRLEQPVNDQLTLIAGFGKRNNINANGAANFELGAAYDLGNELTVSAALAGAQTSKVGDAGKTRLIVGLTKSL